MNMRWFTLQKTCWIVFQDFMKFIIIEHEIASERNPEAYVSTIANDKYKKNHWWRCKWYQIYSFESIIKGFHIKPFSSLGIYGFFFAMLRMAKRTQASRKLNAGFVGASYLW